MAFSEIESSNRFLRKERNGSFYDINVALIGKTGQFLCQKDLLTEGTLEEFERIFEGKIERMAQNTKT